LRIREDAIDECLLFKSVGGCRTGFEEVEQIPPGGWLRIDGDGRISRGVWHDLPEPGSRPTASPESLRELLLEAIEKRLTPHFRPTVFLSGGLDSSIVTAGVQRLVDPDLRPLALSIGYDVGTSEDETGHARRLTEELGVQHEIVTMPAAEVPELLERASDFLEDPVADPITLPFFKLAGVAATETKVILTGDGADEFWGGYDRFENPPESIEAYLSRAMVFQPEELGLDRPPDSYLEGVPIEDELPPLDRIMRLEVRNRLRNYHLSRIDKLSMAHALEARCPFLDATVSHLALQLAGSRKRDGARVKIPLLEASARLLPTWLLERRKQPFTGPVLGWLRSSLRPRVQDLAHHADPRLADRVDIAGLVERLDDPESAKHVAGRLWSLLVLETWLTHTAPRFTTPSPEQLHVV
ncbi:MAG: asparagine synthase C-terminal domain-containing protein, partial [Planctomycetota bacterium]|nr:asparagine synthase C-terminal domain-containing protein [Planctomycetota bacterium]